jgi:hypothetical protein
MTEEKSPHPGLVLLREVIPFTLDRRGFVAAACIDPNQADRMLRHVKLTRPLTDAEHKAVLDFLWSIFWSI